MATASVREVIFAPAEFLKKRTTVGGTIALIDRTLGRMDITDEGAKLIVEIGQVSCMEGLDVSSQVLVTGFVKKQQRRTYLEAQSVEGMTVVYENTDDGGTADTI